MVELFNEPSNKELRKDLRRKQTFAEDLLWRRLRRKQVLGYKFFRQFGVLNYILDFYCPKIRLSIELDGRYHQKVIIVESDACRTQELCNLNITEIRFTNEEVINNIDKVVKQIQQKIFILTS